MWSDQSSVPITTMSTGLPANKETPVCDAIDRVLSAVVRVTFDVFFGFALIPAVLGGGTYFIASLVLSPPVPSIASVFVASLSLLYLLVTMTPYGIWLYQYLAPSVYRWRFGRASRESILKCLETEGDLLRHVPDHLKKDREMTETAIRSTGSALEFVHPDYQNDRSIIEIAVATPTRKRDWPFVLGRGWLLDRPGHALQFASEELRDDVDIVRMAIEGTGEFDFWSDYEGPDTERQNRYDDGPIHKDCHQDMTDSVLLATSERLRDDREIVARAVWRSSKAFQCASHRLRGDAGLVLKAIATEFVGIFEPLHYNLAGKQYHGPFKMPGLETLRHVSDDLFAESRIFYDFLCSLHSGAWLSDEKSEDVWIGRLLREDEDWLKCHVADSLIEQIDQLFGDAELREKALKETKWASWYVVDPT